MNIRPDWLFPIFVALCCICAVLLAMRAMLYDIRENIRDILRAWECLKKRD